METLRLRKLTEPYRKGEVCSKVFDIKTKCYKQAEYAYFGVVTGRMFARRCRDCAKEDIKNRILTHKLVGQEGRE